MIKALVKYLVIAAILAAVLGLISGRACWHRAWAYIAVTVGVQLVTGILIRRANPGLLEERSRIHSGTKGWDRILAPLVALVGPVAMWATAAWDVRCNWPPVVPLPSSIAALAIGVAGALLTTWAMVTNAFFSTTVRIQDDRGHRVVSTGPYAVVRHPGYSGALVFTLVTPIALGSWIALVPAVLTAAVLMLRTALEDRTLQAELAGYSDYAQRVRSRLIPGLW